MNSVKAKYIFLDQKTYAHWSLQTTGKWTNAGGNEIVPIADVRQSGNNTKHKSWIGK
jgi:hypothetical protein